MQPFAAARNHLFTYTYLHMRGEEEQTDGPAYYSINMGSEAVRSSIR